MPAAAQIDILIQARDEASAALTKLNSTLKGTGQRAKIVGEQGVGAFSKLGSSISGLISPIAAVSSALAAGFGLSKIIGTTDEIGTQVRTLSREMGISAESASKLRFAFEETGVSFESGEKGVAKFARALAGVTDLEDGVAIPSGKQMTSLLESIGIAGNDAAGNIRPMNDILADVADKFAGMSDGAEKTALATQLFGRAGRDLIPFLNQGKAGVAALGDEAQKLGLVLDQKTLAAITRNKVAMRTFKAALQGVELQLGVLLLPALTKVITKMTQFAVFINTSVVPVIHKLADIVGPELQHGFDLTVGAFGDAIGVMRELGSAASDLGKYFGFLVRDGIAPAPEILERLPKPIQEIALQIGAIVENLKPLRDEFIHALAPIETLIAPLVGSAIPGLKAALSGLRSVLDVAAFVGFTAVMGTLAASFVAFPIKAVIDAGKSVFDFVKASAGLVSKTISFTIDVVAKGLELLTEILKAPAQLAQSVIQTVTQKVSRSPEDDAKLHPADATQTVTQTVKADAKPLDQQSTLEKLGLDALGKAAGTLLGAALGAGIVTGIGEGFTGGAVLAAISPALPLIGIALVVAAAAAAEGFVAAFIYKTQGLKELITFVLGGLLGLAVKKAIGDFVIPALRALPDAFLDALKDVPNVLGVIGALAAAAFVVNTLVIPLFILRTIRDAIKSAVPLGVELGSAIATGIGSGIADLAGNIGPAVSAIGAFLSSTLPTAFATAFTAAVGVARDILSGLPAFTVGLPEKTASGFKALPGLIARSISGVSDVFRAAFEDLPGIVADAGVLIAAAVVNVVGDVARIFQFGFALISGIVTEPMQSIVDFMRDEFGPRLVGTFQNVFKAVDDVLGGAMSDAFTAVTDGVASLVNGAAFVLSGLANVFQKAFDNAVEIAQSAVAPIGSVLDTIHSAFDGVETAVWDVVHAVDALISRINSIPSPGDILGGALDKIPGAGLIPHAEGGLFTTPHRALIAEDGPEVILPLSKPTRMAQILRGLTANIGSQSASRNLANPTIAPVEPNVTTTIHNHYVIDQVILQGDQLTALASLGMA